MITPAIASALLRFDAACCTAGGEVVPAGCAVVDVPDVVSDAPNTVKELKLNFRPASPIFVIFTV